MFWVGLLQILDTTRKQHVLINRPQGRIINSYFLRKWTSKPFSKNRLIESGIEPFSFNSIATPFLKVKTPTYGSAHNVFLCLETLGGTGLQQNTAQKGIINGVKHTHTRRATKSHSNSPMASSDNYAPQDAGNMV